MRIRLENYDWIVVSTSGGKDSQTMLRRVVALAEAAGVKDRVVAVHADMGQVEWPGVPELAAEQAAHYGVRFEVVSARLWNPALPASGATERCHLTFAINARILNRVVTRWPNGDAT